MTRAEYKRELELFIASPTNRTAERREDLEEYYISVIGGGDFVEHINRKIRKKMKEDEQKHLGDV